MVARKGQLMQNLGGNAESSVFGDGFGHGFAGKRGERGFRPLGVAVKVAPA